MNAHNMFVDISVRAEIHCFLPLRHGLCTILFTAYIVLHRKNINKLVLSSKQC